MHLDSEPLRRYFAGLTENTFHVQLGVVDPPLIDYLSDLLARFVRSDAIYRIRNLVGQPVQQVAEMLCEAEQRVGEARRDVHQHVGDFTLFWTGVFPEMLRRMQDRHTSDHLLDYCVQGKRAYWIASTIAADPEGAPAEILERLSRNFELCAYGLREVRREWESRPDGPPTRPFLIN